MTDNIDIYNRAVSDTRTTEVINTLKSALDIESLARKLLVVRPIQTVDSTEDFVKFGINQILDKRYFVDDIKGDETYYSYKGIGYSEGQRIAQGETKFLLESINQFVGDTTQTINGALTEELLNRIIEQIGGHSSSLVILTNIYNTSDFWYFPSFTGESKVPVKFQERRIEGYFSGVPVYWNNLVEKGTLLLIDKNRLGDMIIKREIAAKITEINASEKQKIVEDIPKLVDTDMRTKVRFYADEVIKIKLKDSSAVTILKGLKV